MRKIKFRGKSLYTTHDWQFGSLLVIGEKKYIIPDTDRIQLIEHRIIPETLGQFTGLFDKNGVEIYEGDIIKIESFVTNAVENKKIENSDFIEYMEVYFDSSIKYNCFSLKIIKTTRLNNFGIGHTSHSFLYTYTNNSEVIGNIHENTELF